MGSGQGAGPFTGSRGWTSLEQTPPWLPVLRPGLAYSPGVRPGSAMLQAMCICRDEPEFLTGGHRVVHDSHKT